MDNFQLAKALVKRSSLTGLLPGNFDSRKRNPPNICPFPREGPIMRKQFVIGVQTLGANSEPCNPGILQSAADG